MGGKGFDVKRGVQRWDLERQVRLVAGSIVLSSVLGSIAVPRLKWLAAQSGGLTYAAVSNTGAMGTALSKLPYNRGATTMQNGPRRSSRRRRALTVKISASLARTSTYGGFTGWPARQRDRLTADED